MYLDCRLYVVVGAPVPTKPIKRQSARDLNEMSAEGPRGSSLQVTSLRDHELKQP